jgi:hypothetical protein
MSGTTSYDLTQLIGFNFNGLESDNVDVANANSGNGDPASLNYVLGTQTYNLSSNDYGGNGSDVGSGPNNVEYQITAATNGAPSTGSAFDNPLAIGQIIIEDTNNSFANQPFTYDVLGYSQDGSTILIGQTAGYAGPTAGDPYNGQYLILSDVNTDYQSINATGAGAASPPALLTFTPTNTYTGGPFFQASTPADPGNPGSLSTTGISGDVVSVTNALVGVTAAANSIVQAASSTVASTNKTGVTYSGYVPASPPAPTGSLSPYGDGGYILHTTVGYLNAAASTFALAAGGHTGVAGQPLLQIGGTYAYVVGFNATQILLQGASSAGVANSTYYAYSKSSVPAANSTSDLNIQFQNFGLPPFTCYLAGTHIATPAGEVAIETLKAGDWVTTISGEAKAVIWVGSAVVDPRRHAEPTRVLPVRVAAGAFGPGAPSRDLFLSPDHAVFVDDMLVPIKELLNGTSIRQVDRGVVTYFHVELAQHDVLLAEGLPAESYLDSGCRGALQGAQLVAGALGEPDRNYMVWESLGYRPLTVSGPALAALRARLGAGGGDSLRMAS